MSPICLDHHTNLSTPKDIISFKTHKIDKGWITTTYTELLQNNKKTQEIEKRAKDEVIFFFLQKRKPKYPITWKYVKSGGSVLRQQNTISYQSDGQKNLNLITPSVAKEFYKQGVSFTAYGSVMGTTIILENWQYLLELHRCTPTTQWYHL